ncbi:S1C family serine protease [Streptacidiphilus monticola]|uniref:S1C family serine protease n=1 Tax=Streptacidiphilus monticola TaxID=2161674 RepID=A0ABW1FXI4_9ACTN
MSEMHRNPEGEPDHTPVPPMPQYAPQTPAPAPSTGYYYQADFSAEPPTVEGAALAAEEAPAAKKRKLLTKPALLVAAVAVISALAGGAAGGVIGSQNRANAGDYSTSAVVTSDSTGSTNVSAIAKAVTPAVVTITVTTGNGEDLGTGIVLTSTGQILTNYHVISSAVGGDATIKITFSDGKTTTATIVGTDASLDVAVIKAQNVSGLTTASLGDSSKVAVGDSVVAIGNPDGLTNTVTSGIVSALNRKVTVDVSESTTQDNGGFGLPFWQGQQGNNRSSSGQTATYYAIQTDASLNPGNSGGPLLNSSGQVVGINASMYSDSSSGGSGSSSAGSVGLGFAIPINAVKAVLGDLQAGKNITS